MTNEERQQIANICRAHDEFMIEHADWMARREAQASPPVEKSGDGAGLIFRTTETERAPAAAAVSTQSSEAEDYPVGRDEVARALGVIIAELRAEWTQEFEKRESRIARLEGQIEMLVALLGQKLGLPTMGKSDVVELPRGFLRRTHDNAA